MDVAMISTIFSSLKAAKELGQAALAVHEFNEVAPIVSNLNSEILKAQDSLFSHNMELLALQQKYFETAKELAEIREAIAQKARYTLFDLGSGQFVYSADARPAGTHMGNPIGAEPEHYVCQKCFDGPEHRKVVLTFRAGNFTWHCTVCRASLYVTNAPDGRERRAGLVGEAARVAGRSDRLP